MWAVEVQGSGPGVVQVGSGAAGELGEGQLAVLLHCGEAKELAAEEEQGVEEDDGGLHPQLDVTCRGEQTVLRK